MHEAALALGMILQRFKLIDHQRYQMHLKETLTIKPEGFKIKVRPRADQRARRLWRPVDGCGLSADSAASAARTRPGHNTPMLVLYGSNLGTAEELATRMADLAEVNGFASKLAPLDDYVGKLPEEGGVLIICASYNGAPPTTRRNSSNGSAAICRRMPLPMCATPCSAAATATGPRPINRCRASSTSNWRSMARAPSIRAARAMRAAISTASSRNGSQRPRRSRPRNSASTGISPARAEDEPLYAIEPVAPTAVNTIVAQGGAVAMKVLVNDELQNKSGANPSERSTRHIEVQLPSNITYRVGDHLSVVPRNDPTLVDSVARRFGFLPADQIRLQVAEGRRAQLPVGDAVSVGRLLSEFVELQQVATRKQIQIMAEHTRCPVTKPKLLAFVGEMRPSRSSAIAPRFWPGANRCSTCCTNIRPANCRSTPIWKCCRCWRRAITRSRRRRRSIRRAAASRSAWSKGRPPPGRGVYKGICSNYLVQPPRGRCHPCHRARDQGRLPAAR